LDAPDARPSLLRVRGLCLDLPRGGLFGILVRVELLHREHPLDLEPLARAVIHHHERLKRALNVAGSAHEHVLHLQALLPS